MARAASARTGTLSKGSSTVQKLVNWWCELIGVTDPLAIQIATAIIAAGSLVLGAVWIFNTFFWAAGANTHARLDGIENFVKRVEHDLSLIVDKIVFGQEDP
jgi:hypothetical protein